MAMGKEGDPGVTAADNRLFVDAVLWIGKTGAQWRDLPERFDSLRVAQIRACARLRGERRSELRDCQIVLTCEE